MTRDEIASHPCRVLTSEQRERYFEQGYVALEPHVSRPRSSRTTSVRPSLVRW